MYTNTAQPLLPSQVMEAKREFARRFNNRLKSLQLNYAQLEARTRDVVLNNPHLNLKGVDRSNMYKYAAGDVLPTDDTIKVLALALGCQPEDLLPTELPRTTRPGRRKLLKDVMHLSARGAGGLHLIRLRLDVVMPADTAIGLYRLLAEYARKTGMQVDPPTNIADAKLDAQTITKIVRDLVQPPTYPTH